MRRHPRPSTRVCFAAALALVSAASCCSTASAAAWYFNDGGTPSTWGTSQPPTGPFSHIELMADGVLSGCVFAFLDPDTNYVAITDEIAIEYLNYDFGATLLMYNAQSGKSFVVKCSLFVTQDAGSRWVSVGTDTAIVTYDGVPPPVSGPTWHHFEFGTMGYRTSGERLKVEIDYRASPGNTASTYLYWDGSSPQCSSGLFAWKGSDPADHVVCEYEYGNEPAHPDTYWYDVTSMGPRRDFHVQVFDDDPSHYSGWVEPPNWSHTLHQVGCDWWVSWYASSAADTLSRLEGFRFQFVNESEKTWGKWTTTRSGTADPDSMLADSSDTHGAQSDGKGGKVHVPKKPDGSEITPVTPFDPGRFKGDATFTEYPGIVSVCAISGENDAGAGTSIYTSVDGEMVPLQQLTGVSNEGSGNLAWGDYDGDGWPDLALAGMSPTGRVTQVYHNDQGNLVLVAGPPLVGLDYASIAWADYDMDGRPELLAMGYDGAAARTIIYDWSGGGLFEIELELLGLYAGSADWADWDGDGDPDLLVTGSTGPVRRTVFYRNDFPGPLVDIGNQGLPDVALSDAEWGDCDGDGDLDLAFTGEASAAERVARVYRNDGGVFVIAADLMNVYRSSCAWGDVDLDGDLDVAFCGYTGSDLQTAVYLNTASGFVDSGIWIPGVREGALAWGDMDGDCDPDLLVVGADWGQKYSQPYENDLLYVAGVPDDAPDGLVPRGRVAGYPNPFGPTTSIRWMLSEGGTVTVGIYDLSGRLVRGFAPARREAGEQELMWDGLSDDGRAVPSGVYFCRVGGAGLAEVGKVVLVR
jgi:hypothetical protein